jgi:hypothetical protein
VRADARVARDDVSFYQLPFIELRDIPVARDQDENAGVAEAELRWNATLRWALIGFLGAGRAWGDCPVHPGGKRVALDKVGPRSNFAERAVWLRLGQKL